MDMPKFVKYNHIGDGDGAGIKYGDVLKVLTCGRFHPTYLYVETPIQSRYCGSSAMNENKLKGKKFTYLTDCEYEIIKEEKKVETKHKFKVGDIVCGNGKGRYGFTNADMTKGLVVGVGCFGYIDVKILEHRGYKGETVFSDLNPEYFDLVERKSETISPPPPAPTPDNLYYFTTDMKTFVNLEHNGNKGWSKCDIRCDEFDIHYGVDLAMERLDEVENPEKFGDAPKYVKIINKNYCSGGGVEFGDVCKVLSTHKDSGYLYIKCPEKTNFGGDGANDKNALIGVNFTFVCREDYEPVDFNIHD